MVLQPDLVIEKGKDGRLPPSLNSGIVISKFPFPIGIEVNHDKFQNPTITLLPVEEKKEQGVIGNVE